MPGLVGIIENNQSTKVDSLIRQMKCVLEHPSPCIEEIRIAGEAAFAVIRRGDDRADNSTTDDKDILLAFWGHLWDSANPKGKAELEGRPAEDVSTAHMLLDLFRNEGLSGFYSLNGRFAIALWDKKHKTLHLVSDRYGFCKLYYWSSSARILFASEYKAIISHEAFQKRVDEEAMADFMTFGYCLGDKTFFRDIKLLPYGSVLTFHEGNASIKRYWDYRFRDGSSWLYEPEEYVERYNFLLEKACRKQLDGKKNIGLPLSGGLDSRALAGMLDKVSFAGGVKTFSYGNPECFDVVYGKRIARKLNFDHEYIPIRSSYLKEHAKSFVWLTEGTVNCLNSHMMLTHRFLKEQRIDAVVTGFLGDTVAGEPIVGFKPYKTISREDEFLREVFERQTDIMSDDEALRYFRNDVYRKITGRPFMAYKSDYNRLALDNRYYKSIYAELVGRQRRYTSFNLYAFEGYSEVLAPFTDNEFVDFALLIPDVLAFTRFVEKETIVKYLPKVASVPWNKTRLPLNASRLRKGLHWRWERLNRNPLVRATIAKRYARMNDNYLNAGEAIRKGSNDFVVSRVRDNSFLAEYFEMDRVRQLLDDHMMGTCNAYGKITALLTLCLWHELFVEGNADGC
jgi:asparagine synthase (glutamine-hydrolysing)